jgi:hypothetical protein
MKVYIVTYSGGKFYSAHATIGSANHGAKVCEDNQLAGGNWNPCVEVKCVDLE